MKLNLFFYLFGIFMTACMISAYGQNKGVVKGKVIDVVTREALSNVNIFIPETSIGTSTNNEGLFTLSNVPLGYIKIQVSYLGYVTQLSEDYLVTIEKSPYILFELNQENRLLDEVVVQRKLFQKSLESPLSVQSLGMAEIEKYPGGNRDIIKVIRSLPGVASNPGFRNDIIIRGGAPFENKFYLDGIEVPVINHFQTQGATGGPVGIINADLIRKVVFHSSAFPADRGGALSSIIEFTQKEGNPFKLNTRATLGTSDAGITLDGPLGARSNFIASIRQSYLQLLFKLIKLPFLPTYNDFQVKVTYRPSQNSELSWIGIGAIDNFELNKDVDKNVTDDEIIKRNRYILGNIPVQEQWNYTVGVSYKHFGEKSMQQFILSSNTWNNNAKKYFDNTNSPDDLLLDYNSREIEHKFRFEHSRQTQKNLKLKIGFALEQAIYTNETFQKIANASGVESVAYFSKMNLFKYRLFGQISKTFSNDKLGVSFGATLEGVNYNSFMKNPLNQFSPRVSLTYLLAEKWRLNASLGGYYQLPAYTIMGYRDASDILVNKANGLQFLHSNHYVAGFEFSSDTDSKITLEGFYKSYSKYPFSIRDQISLANLGSDFGVIGNEEVVSNSKGRAYGFEVLARKKSYGGLYGLLSYTFVKSEFRNATNTYIPTTWDNRHLLTATGGNKMKKNWELGGKFRLVGGRPYTPYNMAGSSLIENYDVANRGILDYTKLNSERFGTYHQLDIRIDKTWFWKHISLNFYLDVQNVYAGEAVEQAYLIPSADSEGNKLTTGPNYKLESIENSSGNILPSIGLIVDF